MENIKYLLSCLFLISIVSCQEKATIQKQTPQHHQISTRDAVDLESITVIDEISQLEGKVLMPDELLFSEENQSLLEAFGNLYNYGEEKKIIYLEINEMVVPTEVSTIEFGYAVYTLVGGGLNCECESNDPNDIWCLVGTSPSGIQWCDDLCAECCMYFIPNDVGNYTNAPLFREVGGILHQVE